MDGKITYLALLKITYLKNNLLSQFKQKFKLKNFSDFNRKNVKLSSFEFLERLKFITKIHSASIAIVNLVLRLPKLLIKHGHRISFSFRLLDIGSHNFFPFQTDLTDKKYFQAPQFEVKRWGAYFFV